MDLHTIRVGLEILLVSSCYKNRDKLRPDRPLGSYAYFTLLYDPVVCLMNWRAVDSRLEKKGVVLMANLSQCELKVILVSGEFELSEFKLEV